MKLPKQRPHWTLTRRSFVQTVIGLLGSLTFPAQARSENKQPQQRFREAEFYHQKDRSPDDAGK